jgi:hypothetical protein
LSTLGLFTLGLFLNPRGPLLTHLHTVYIAYSECLPTPLTPPAERTCFSQVLRAELAEGRAQQASEAAANAELRRQVR